MVLKVKKHFNTNLLSVLVHLKIMLVFQNQYNDVVSYFLVNMMCRVFNEAKYKIHHTILRSSVAKYTIYAMVNKVINNNNPTP